MVSSERGISFAMEIMHTFWMVKLKKTPNSILAFLLWRFSMCCCICMCVCVCDDEWSKAHTLWFKIVEVSSSV